MKLLNQYGDPISAKVPEKLQLLNPFEQNVINSLGGLTNIFAAGNQFLGGPGAPLSSANTMYYNNRWYLISNNRALTTEMYVEHGIVQTLIDQPVDDGFRAGFEIKTDQLSPDQVEDLQVFVEQERVIDEVMQTLKWARLYGGAGTLIVTDQDPSKPLNINAINRNTPLAFKAADLWELFFGIDNIPEIAGFTITPPGMNAPFYDYYGIRVDASRVLPVRGKAAPSFLRPRLRGWGMSELERLVRSINQYLKNQDVIFELLDEAKIDVYRIKGFTQSLATAAGTAAVASRIQHSNLLKNYNNALTMDTNDEYDQKQMTFTGLAEMLQQTRIQIAGDMKMPVTKLFGMSSAGFNSGEDDIENYNSMIEGEVRSKSKYHVVNALRLCCQKLFEFMPTDLQIVWNPLRILSAEEQEKVKDSQHKRVLDTFNAGLCSDLEAKSAINKGNLLPIDIDETLEAELPFEEDEDLTDKKGELE